MTLNKVLAELEQRLDSVPQPNHKNDTSKKTVKSSVDQLELKTSRVRAAHLKHN